MSIVKLIEQMWRHDKQNRNALAIADEAGKMLDKLRGFLDDMDRLDKSISAVPATSLPGRRNSNNSARNRKRTCRRDTPPTMIMHHSEHCGLHGVYILV